MSHPAKQKTIDIFKTLMGIQFHVNKNGYIEHTQVDVRPIIEKLTTHTYVRQWKTWVVDKRYRYYDAERSIMYLPGYMLDYIKNVLDVRGYNYAIHDVEPVEGKDVEIPLQDWFKPKSQIQEEGINFLNAGERLAGISLQTGGGKTASIIAHLSHVGKRALIGVAGLHDQWVESILKFTKLTEEDLYVVKGGASLRLLLEEIDKTLHPKIIIYSLKTLQPWSMGKPETDDLPPFALLMELLDVGIRAVDEAHLNFYMNLIMDIQLNMNLFRPVTATFDVTDPTIRTIYDSHYPKAIRFGEDRYKKYIHVTAYTLSTGKPIPPFAVLSNGMYSHARYEKWFLRKQNKKDFAKLLEHYETIIDEHFISKRKKEHKLLVMCQTLIMCEEVLKFLKKKYPKLKSAIFKGGESDDILKDNEIIVGTIKSCGEAKDIPHLKVVLQTVSVRSRPMNIQNLGRLREINGEDVEFVYVKNHNVTQHGQHHNERKLHFIPRSKSFKEHVL